MLARVQKYREELNHYYQQKVNTIFSKMMLELMLDKPENVVDWCIQWLDSKGRSFEYKTKKIEVESEEEVEEVDQLEDLPIRSKQNTAKCRTSVSAEAFGIYNKAQVFISNKSNFKEFAPQVIQKSEEQKQKISERLNQNFMFQTLNQNDLNVVINAMSIVNYKADEIVIQQNQQGDHLYVCDQGELDCFKQFPGSDQDKYLKTYGPGEHFGELALLYNAPRAATIKAKTDSTLFALDRSTFNNIVKDAAIKKQERIENVIKKIEILMQLDNYERLRLQDGLQEEKFKCGDYIIREGEEGHKFYMVEEGELIATKYDQDSNEQNIYQIMDQMLNRDYFGELALMKNVPRQANVIAQSDVNLLVLDQGAFMRLLGPLEEILRRNQEKYKQFVESK